MRKLAVIALALTLLTGLADARFVYYKKTLGWRFTPAAAAVSYRVEILYSTNSDFQVYIETLPPDTVTEDGKLWVKFDVTVEGDTTYQLQIVAIGDAGQEIRSMVSAEVEHRISPGIPEPTSPPDEVIPEDADVD